MFRRIFFVVLAVVTLFLYIEIFSQLWFLKLLHGYLIRVWVPVFILAFSLLVWRIKHHDLIFSRIDLVAAFYLIFAALSMSMTGDSLFLTVKYYLIMAMPVVMYFVLIDFLRKNEDVVKFILLIVYTVFIYCAIVFICYGRFSPVPGQEREVLTTNMGNTISMSQAWFVDKGKDYFRGTFFLEHSKYCGILAPAALFLLFLFLTTKGRKAYVYFILGFLPVFVSVSTLSRAGVVTLVAGILFMLYLFIRYDRVRRLKACGAFGFYSFISILVVVWKKPLLLRLLQVLNFLNIPWINDYLMKNGVLEYSVGNRLDPHLASVGVTFKNFLLRPWFGCGYVYTEQSLAEHNRYLFILVSSGIFTFLAYFIFLVLIILSVRYAALAYQKYDGSSVNYGFFFYACCVMYFFKLMNEGMETYYYWIIFALAFAWARNIMIGSAIKDGEKDGIKNIDY